MKEILQITLINALSPFFHEIIYSYVNNLPFQDEQFDSTMESVRKGEIKELKVFPIDNCTKFRQEFLDDILVDGYPDKDKLNVELVSKSGIHYFIVDGRCFLNILSIIS